MKGAFILSNTIEYCSIVSEVEIDPKGSYDRDKWRSTSREYVDSMRFKLSVVIKEYESIG